MNMSGNSYIKNMDQFLYTNLMGLKSSRFDEILTVK